MTSPISSNIFLSHFSPLASGLPDGLRGEAALNYTWAGVACLVFFIAYTSTRPKNLYDAIPAVGRTGFISSYLDAIQYTKRGQDFIMEGYARYQPGIFRVPEMTGWRVLVSGPQLTDELRKAPDDVLSFTEAVKDTTPTAWIIGMPDENHYVIPIVRNQLTRNLGTVFSDLRQEIVVAFDDNIPLTEHIYYVSCLADWTQVQAYNTVMNVVSRASNRVFVGAPLCRDPDYLALNTKFAVDMAAGGRTIAWFPDILKPIATHLFTNVPKSIRITLKYLKPIIEERLKKIEEYGSDYPDKPVDMLSWLLDEAQGKQRTPENLTYQILMLNFAAIHTSSISFTGALFELASRPEYIEPIRQEVEAVIAEAGWTKAAMTRMRKLDSFLKESQRMKGISSLSIPRRALKEFMFSDGTRLPKGALVAAVSTPRHLDDEVYPDAKTFKGFRFSDMREEEGEGTKNHMVVTSTDFLAFGHGRHGCPGRFFAVNEIKTMMAHVILTYDLRMTESPQDTGFRGSVVPDRQAEVWFRKRRA